MIHLIEKKEQIKDFAPLFKKSNLGLTIDPGLNTGLCFWQHDEIAETITLVGRGEDFYRQVNVDTQFRTILRKNPRIDYMVVEGVEVWDGLVSQTSAKRGDLSELAYLVGMLVGSAKPRFIRNTSMTYYTGIKEIFIINPSVWKAQLTYKALGVWVNKIIGLEFKTEHELAAVGIGLFCQGRLH